MNHRTLEGILNADKAPRSQQMNDSMTSEARHASSQKSAQDNNKVQAFLSDFEKAFNFPKNFDDEAKNQGRQPTHKTNPYLLANPYSNISLTEEFILLSSGMATD